ncbi:TPA: tail fiber protein, partial [Yersinia enterocolitica]|nr:tail fiber protein [Yersinia enterocolitica]
MGLELTPDTGSSTNFKVYNLLCVGAAGSRVFTFNQDWNSANPIPLSGGGTGATTAAGALVNLGLGEGSLIPIGVPLPYPLATAPTGYLKCNGSSFSTTTYPQLAVAYPSGVLPDLRAFTIRGWDDGRGIDTGRTLLSEQADALQNITGGMIDMITSTTPSASGAFALTNNIIGYTDQTARSGRIVNFNFDASR